MRRVLVLGGYGGFGARISRRLAEAGFEVLVAGRSLDLAHAFCVDRPHLVPIRVDRDRDRDLAGALAEHRPFALVDAAGPFQGQDHAVPRACLLAGIHYLDIADARDFVTGFAALDPEARDRGLVLVSGASSVPALSGAACRALAQGLDEIAAVEVAISASNRAAAGASVTRAILSYLGRPIRLWRGRRWVTGFGWQDMVRQGFAVEGACLIQPRLVALADVPDLDLLPDRLPGRPAVTFRAGTELDLANLALWLLSWLVRSRILRSMSPFSGALLRLQRVTRRLGSARSGMIVRMFGMRAGQRVERRWTLIAERGDGPEIPALTVPILLDRLAAGTLAPGARDAGEILALVDYEPAFSALAIRHEIREHPARPSLYRRIMGAAFDGLAPTVRATHETLREAGAGGRAIVTRGRHPLARLAAALIGFPPEGEHALHVEFTERDGVETWTRSFGPHRFRSRMSERDGLLVERFGLLQFGFMLAVSRGGLAMELRRWWLGPVPLPLRLAPRTMAREWEEDGRFQLEVRIGLPLAGALVTYRGWLVRM